MHIIKCKTTNTSVVVCLFTKTKFVKNKYLFIQINRIKYNVISNNNNCTQAVEQSAPPPGLCDFLVLFKTGLKTFLFKRAFRL